MWEPMSESVDQESVRGLSSLRWLRDALEDRYKAADAIWCLCTSDDQSFVADSDENEVPFNAAPFWK